MPKLKALRRLSPVRVGNNPARAGNENDAQFIILGEVEPVADLSGISIYNGCNNVIGVMNLEEFRGLILLGIQALADNKDPLFSCLVCQDTDE